MYCFRRSLCFASIVFILFSSHSYASFLEHDDGLGFSFGDTYAHQNINTLSTSEIFYFNNISAIQAILPSFIKPMYELNFGVLKSSGTQSWLVGVGPKLGLTFTNDLYLTAGFRFVYLDEYKFRTKDNNHMRHYGGHRQFQYYWDLNYSVNSHVTVGYRWLHMSNGMQVLPESLKYDHNPVIETHNLVLTFDFY
ncbi:acyloxyacyl hydrolase [Pseudomonas sp. HK3]